MTGPERRTQLLRTARGVFAGRGYEGASVDAIADAAGVTKPVVYEHFASKEQLYEAVVGREVEIVTSRLLACFDAAGPPRLIAEAAAATFLDYIDSRPDGFRVLLHDAPAGGGAIGSVIGEVADETEALIAEVFGERGYDPGHAPMYARMLVGAVALVGEWWLETRTPPPHDVAAHVVNLMWNGLKDLDHDPALGGEPVSAAGDPAGGPARGSR